MNIFIAFADQDRDVRDKLLRQMNLVAGRQGWNIWSSKEIKAGEHWDDEIKRRLMDSEVVILLLSTDFFNSKYIIETELPKVVEKHQLGECQIIPVIARVCHWKETTFGEYAELGDIQALPVGEKPIVSRGWDNDDQPYFEVVEGVKEAIKAFQQKKLGLSPPNSSSDLDDWVQTSTANTIRHYEYYLARHPQGKYADKARHSIEELKQKDAAPVVRGLFAVISGGVLALFLVAWLATKSFSGGGGSQLPESSQHAEESAFRFADSVQTIPAWRDFLQKHPLSPCIPDAQSGLDKLQKSRERDLADARVFIKEKDYASARSLLQSVMRISPVDTVARQLLNSIQDKK